MTYALLHLQTEQKQLQLILADSSLTENEHGIIKQIIDCIQSQIEEIMFMLS